MKYSAKKISSVSKNFKMIVNNIFAKYVVSLIMHKIINNV